MGQAGFEPLLVKVPMILYIGFAFLSRMKKRGKSKEFLKDEDIERWYRNVARGALVTADTYLRRLRAFCEWAEKTPQEIAALGEGDLYDLLLDFVSYEEKRGSAGSYIESTLKAVKSWLNHNGIVLNRKIKVRGSNQTPSLENERVPTQEELKMIFLNSTPRDRVSCVLMSHAGVRPEVIGNYRGDDGLRIKDLPELKIEDETVTFEKIPAMVVIRPELSKTNLKYFTFLSEEGCDYIKAYLEERLRNGENLGPDSDVVSPKTANKSFIRSINVSDGIRKSIRAAGFPWRPYVLRAYCDTQLLVAESKGKIIHSYRQFLMGHKGDIEGRYTTNKNKLPENLIEDLRQSYKNCQPYLQTVATRDQEESFIQMRKQYLILSKVPKEEVKKMDLMNLEDEELIEIVDEYNKRRMSDNGKRQKVITSKEIKKYIEQGWEFVSSLPDGNITVSYTHLRAHET